MILSLVTNQILANTFPYSCKEVEDLRLPPVGVAINVLTCSDHYESVTVPGDPTPQITFQLSIQDRAQHRELDTSLPSIDINHPPP